MTTLRNMPTEKLELILTLVAVFLILAIPQYGVILAFIIVFAYLRRSKNRKALLTSIGLRRPQNWILLVVITAVLGCLIEVIAEVLFNPLIEHFTGFKIDLSEVDLSSFGAYLVWILIGFVLGGLLEEILFRGFLITRISKFLKSRKTADVLALFITSALFGLCHLYQGWSGVISTGIIGFIFGVIFLAFHKNLWYAILTHGFVNMAALTILYFGYYDQLEHLLF